MQKRFEAARWDQLTMDLTHPFKRTESVADETAAVQGALNELNRQGILASADYPQDRLEAHTQAVRQQFNIPWSAISPRLQRLLYAINAIHQPAVMVAVGVFCGFTYISNAGAGHGPGKCYDADELVGIEIDPTQADLARSNVASLGADGPCHILAVDGVDWLQTRVGDIHLLYIDATAPGPEGKSLYSRILRAALPHLPKGALVLAHNSENAADSIRDFLTLIQDPAEFEIAINILVDNQGLAVARR